MQTILVAWPTVKLFKLTLPHPRIPSLQMLPKMANTGRYHDMKLMQLQRHTSATHPNKSGAKATG